MKYKTNKRNLSEMWADMYNYYYSIEKRAMEQSGIPLSPYGKEVCGRRTDEFLADVEDEKKYRLLQALKGNRYAFILKPYWR